MTDEIGGARIAARRDRANVPDRRAPRIEIRRLDQKKPTLLIFFGDVRKQLIIDIVRDGLIERSRIGEGVLGERCVGDEPLLEDARRTPSALASRSRACSCSLAINSGSSIKKPRVRETEDARLSPRRGGNRVSRTVRCASRQEDPEEDWHKEERETPPHVPA